MKKYVRTIVALSAAVLTFLATVGVANACFFWHYEPKVPAALEEE